MKIINPSFEIIEQQAGLEGMYKHIELAGRTCYKSEDKITNDSAEGFVNRMIKSNHTAMLEHGTVYLKVPYKTEDAWGTLNNRMIIANYEDNTYSIVKDFDHCAYITTNYRVIVENKYEKHLQFICEPTEYHEKRVTVRFITDQGILREFTRHRVFSFAVESTRYCNYSKDKFGKELTYIMPCWLPDGDLSVPAEECFKYALIKSEQAYFQLLKEGWTPQQARNVLPLATKCEIIMTGFVNDWKHFFDLRALGITGAPHPQAKELAKPLYDIFIQRGYIK